MYSEYTVDEMTNDPTLLDNAREKTFEFTGTETILEMEINLYDGLDQNTVYYVNVIPKDSNGIPGQISVQDLWFRLSDLSSGEGMFIPVEQHTAAGANMSLANITHSCNPDCTAVTTSAKTITLKRFAVDGSDLIDIYLQNSSSNSFTRLATVNMSDEQYSLSTNTNGEHIFKFTPNNDGVEIHYIVNIS
ncbi:hypothetical protein KKG31_01590 [Patescibacteria group bacterium]|nr:hypothetical protein [Patescibacteria group bacterium]MBU1757869.1 hypothetical protein [Patescibacteria group bacterium]